MAKEEAKAHKAFPIGAGIWLRIHPEDRVRTPYTSWRFDTTTTRMPEFTAPGLGRESNRVTIDAELGANASGVLYALGGASAGLTLYMDKGIAGKDAGKIGGDDSRWKHVGEKVEIV